MKYLLLISCLLAVACGTQTFYASFIHSVLDGPLADVWVNNKLAWSNVAPGTVTPYEAFDMSDIYLNNNPIPAATVIVYRAGTETSYFNAGPWGVVFENTTIYSGYVAIFGVYNKGVAVAGSPMYLAGHYNLNSMVQSSQFCAFRPIFAGPTMSTNIRVRMQKLYLGSYRTYLDSRVEQVGNSLYSTMSNGDYLVTIFAEQSTSPLYSANITLAAGKSYSLIIMGNSTVTTYTRPIFTQLTEDVIPEDSSSSSDTPFPIPEPTMAPPAIPCPPSSASGPNLPLIGLFLLCLAFFAWAARRMWGTAKQEQPVPAGFYIIQQQQKV